jgi:SAM-dependent methyltransferase
MKRKDLLLKIKHEASRLEAPSLFSPVRARELLKYDGEEFIDVLYRKILKRDPDAAGKAHYLSLVRELPKPLIIYSFSRSEEAKQKETKIAGLYSTLISLCLRTPSALVSVSYSVMREALVRVNSFLSFYKAAEERKVDYFRFYLDFEEKFRGSEEEIGHGLKLYLSLLHGVNGSVIDLGSGRGEWLRLLDKEGFNAKGVEINPYCIEKCEEEGLEVVKGDASRFLKNARSSSVGAVTAFHLIEHLDQKERLSFLKEIYRVLKPGGALIVETPNPRNILVSAGDFWRDPEHSAPVFPDTLSFMAKFVGFPEVRCYFFNESRSAFIDSLDIDFRDLKDYIEVSRDFALFARKS